MAVTIDYSTFVINVPRADMTLVATTPTEIRQLDIDSFRIELNGLMENVTGIVFPTNHEHTPPLTIAGVTLARVVEILDPYTITFEDGFYNVNIVGGNSNISDVVNKNSVGVNTANSAGLQDPFSLQAASFVAGSTVYVKTSGSISGTSFPKGTRGFPVNNFADALTIATARGIVTIGVIGSASISTEDFSLGYKFVGDSPATSIIGLDTSANLLNCEFENATIAGVLDGGATCTRCFTGALTMFNGALVECSLSGTITLGPGADAFFVNCVSAVPGGGAGAYPTIDMGGATSTDLAIRGYSGGIEITNCSEAIEASVDMVSGRIMFTNTITAGNFTVRGIADVTDNSGGTAVITDSTLTSATMEIVGLSGRNKVVEVLTKNTSGLPTSQRVRVYDTEANANIDNGVTGLLHEYTVTDTLTGDSLDKHTMTI